MDESNDWEGLKLICFLVLGPMLMLSLCNATSEYGLAGFLLILFIYLAPAFALDMLIKFDKARKQRKVRPTNSDISRAGDDGERRIKKTSDAFLKKVRTMLRR